MCSIPRRQKEGAAMESPREPPREQEQAQRAALEQRMRACVLRMQGPLLLIELVLGGFGVYTAYTLYLFSGTSWTFWRSMTTTLHTLALAVPVCLLLFSGYGLILSLSRRDRRRIVLGAVTVLLPIAVLLFCHFRFSWTGTTLYQATVVDKEQDDEYTITLQPAGADYTIQLYCEASAYALIEEGRVYQWVQYRFGDPADACAGVLLDMQLAPSPMAELP